MTVGIAQDQGIAEYVQEHPGADAMPPLAAALARWTRPVDPSRDFGGIAAKTHQVSTLLEIRAALAACRGEDFDEEEERERLWRSENPVERKPKIPDRGRR